MQPDLAARLAQALHDREAAWTFVREFAEAWSAPLTDTDGTGNDELDAAEARLGVKLPRAVREAYLLFGRRPDLTSNQDRLLAPEKLFVDHGMLVFREENQWVAHWGVPLEALDQDDPPVTMWMSLADPAADPKTAWLDRFSVACVEMVLSESLFEPEDLAASMGDSAAAAGLPGGVDGDAVVRRPGRAGAGARPAVGVGAGAHRGGAGRVRGRAGGVAAPVASWP